MDYVCPSKITQWNCAIESDKHYALMANPPLHPSAMHAPMPQYYMLRDQRRIEHVPRPILLSPPHESIPAITFSVNGWAGVRIKDILKDTVTIDNPYDTVFEHHGWRSIVINLEWPGYEFSGPSGPMKTRIDVRPGGHYMTREILMKEVAGLLFHLHKTASRHPVSPGWEKWELTAGPEGIRVTDMVLMSLHYYRNVWVPELYVIE